MRNEYLRHTLATLAYRFQKCVRDAPEGFGAFEAGAGVKTPIHIINHMTNLFLFVGSAIQEKERKPQPEVLDLKGEVARFHQTLESTDGLLVTTELATPTYLKLLQGPFSDALTHVGQLAMLRRLAGKSITGESYVKANIRIGHVSADQS